MNKLVIASAGSGKTRLIINDSLKKAALGKKVLITTFTEACKKEIEDRITEEKGYIPNNITIQTWFSFLIKHGVKPFQGNLFEYDVKGMILVDGRSGFLGRSKHGFPVFIPEAKFHQYYFTRDRKIYSDKLAQLVVRCNENSDGAVFDRLSRCFDVIYIDEVQDLAGYDLIIIELLFNLGLDITLVGDPRQATYSTANVAKYRKYKKANIIGFFSDLGLDVEINDTSLNKNFRCNQPICNLADALYPNLPSANSKNNVLTGHDGLFAVKPEDAVSYLENFSPMQLRENIKTNTIDAFEAINFGKSKGLSYDRVLIYPSAPMIKLLQGIDDNVTDLARAKLYVAVTRARYSVAFVLKANEIKKIKELTVYTNNKITTDIKDIKHG